LLSSLLCPALSQIPSSDSHPPSLLAAHHASDTATPWKQIADFFHRVEVRDVFGEQASVLFNPGEMTFNPHSLKVGSTLFVRYAQKCFFSDMSTEVLKVDDTAMVKVSHHELYRW
jgi:hypothetical protein